MAKCYEPSQVVGWIHEEIPFVNIAFNNSDSEAEELIDNLDKGIHSFYDYFLRAVVCGIIVLILCLLVPILTCICHCCTICACKRGGKKDSCTHKCCSMMCGAMLIGLVVANIAVIGAGLWAEGQFSSGFKDNFGEIQQFLSNTSSLVSGGTSESSSSLELLSTFETSSDLVFIIAFTILLIPIVTTFVAYIFTCICKHPLVMILSLIFLMLMSLLIAAVIGIAIMFLILYADVCVGLEQKQLHDDTQECIEELTGFTDTLENLCTDAYLYGVIMLGAIVGTMVAYMCLQVSGGCIAGLYTGYRRSARITPQSDVEEHELVAQEEKSITPQPSSVTEVETPAPESTNPSPETTESDTAPLLGSIEVETETSREDKSDKDEDKTEPSAPPLIALSSSTNKLQEIELGDDTETV